MLHGITCGNGVFCAVGDQMVFTSFDGMVWSRRFGNPSAYGGPVKANARRAKYDDPGFFLAAC